MAKLYRLTGTVLEFWEAWEEGKQIIVHFGIVGHDGAVQKIPLRRGESGAEILDAQIKYVQSRGFEARPLEKKYDITVALPVTAESLEELDAALTLRHQ